MISRTNEPTRLSSSFWYFLSFFPSGTVRRTRKQQPDERAYGVGCFRLPRAVPVLGVLSPPWALSFILLKSLSKYYYYYQKKKTKKKKNHRRRRPRQVVTPLAPLLSLLNAVQCNLQFSFLFFADNLTRRQINKNICNKEAGRVEGRLCLPGAGDFN